MTNTAGTGNAIIFGGLTDAALTTLNNQAGIVTASGTSGSQIRVPLSGSCTGCTVTAGTTAYGFGFVTAYVNSFSEQSYYLKSQFNSQQGLGIGGYIYKPVGGILSSAPMVQTGANTQLNFTNAAALEGVTGTITGTALTASCDSGTVMVPGAVVGHPVAVASTTGADVGGAFYLRASVTSTNTVTVYVCGTGTPSSLAYNVSVF